MTEDEAKVRCHNKLPPPNNLIRPIIPVHRRSVSIKWQSAASRLKKILLPPEWCSSKPAAPGVSFSSLSSWSICVFSSSFLWNWLCPLYSPLSLSADAAVIEKHTLLWPRSLPPLPDSHWLPVRGDITLLLCLPASLSPPPFPPCLPLSLSLSSPQFLWILTIPLLCFSSILPPVPYAPISLYTVRVITSNSFPYFGSSRYDDAHWEHCLWPFNTSLFCCCFISGAHVHISQIYLLFKIFPRQLLMTTFNRDSAL